MILAEALNLKTTTDKDGHVTLIQSNSTSSRDIVDNQLKNIKNMGYEGTFWFGDPS